MSTPIVDIPMPYGVTVLGDGTNVPKPAARHPKQNGTAGLSLQPGPCRVSVSWEGPEEIKVILQNGPNYRTFDTIPEKAGGGVSSEDVHRRCDPRGLCLPCRIGPDSRFWPPRHDRGLSSQLDLAPAGAVV